MIVGASIPEDIIRAILQGVPPGTVYALIALGFVLTYKTSGVFNLAFGAQAYVSAALYFKLKVAWGWSTVPALVVAVVVVAPLLGLILERLIFRNLRTAGALPKLVVAIGLSVALPSLFDWIARFEIIPGRSPEGMLPGGNTVLYEVFGLYSFSRNELAAMAVAGLAAVGMGMILRFTSLGLQMRAVVESPRLTELNGIDAERVSAASWMLSSLFAGLAGVLIAPRFQTFAAGNFFQLMIIAIAGAAIGRLASLPLALAGGLGLGVFIAQVNTFLPRWSNRYSWLEPLQENASSAIPFVVLFLVLVFVPAIRSSREVTDPLSGVDPPPPYRGGSVRDRRQVNRQRAVNLLIVVAVGLVVFSRADRAWLFIVTQGVVMSVIFLSITVLSGFAGEISLCQGAFAAIGAYSVFQLATEHSVPALPALVIGAVIAAAVGAVLAIPLRRLGGVWTAIGTLAFAYFFDSVVVKLSWVGGGTTVFAGTAVPRPSLGPIDFESDKSFLVLSLAVLVLVAVAVLNIEGGTVGRTLSAFRGSEVAAQSIGISSSRARGMAFAISAAIAAIGGGLLAMMQRDVNYATSFPPFNALFWVVIVAVLGVTSVNGAIQAGMSSVLFDAVILKGEFLGWILRSPDRIPEFFPVPSYWVFILFGLAAIHFAKHPEGFVLHGQARSAARRAEKATPADP